MKHRLNTEFAEGKFLYSISIVAGISMLLLCGCGYRTHLGELEIMGERTNSNGSVSKKIMREIDTSSKEVLFTPEGPRRSVKYRIKYFVQEKDVPGIELSFVSDKDFYFNTTNEFQFCEKCWAVSNSPLWVATGMAPERTDHFSHDAIIDGKHEPSLNVKDVQVVVFNDNRVLVHRIFIAIPKWQSSQDEFDVENGNREVIINSTAGIQKYDVLNDRVTDVKQERGSGK